MEHHERPHQQVEKKRHHSDITNTGCPSGIDEKTRRKHIIEAAKRHAATLKELHVYLTSTDQSLQVTTISHICAHDIPLQFDRAGSFLQGRGE